MPDTSINDKLGYYVELVFRYYWYILVPFCISMICGIVLVFTLPEVYSSRTLILIEAQKVPTSFVQSIVSSDIDSRISTISQQIMSRTNIEKIMNQFDLLSGGRYGDMFVEDKVADIRKRISIDVTRSREGVNAFSIAFKGEDPTEVKNVANALASYFIDENLRVREAQAIGTSEFLESERIAMLGRLESVENALKEYRIRNMGQLPEQLTSNLSVLNRLQEQLTQRQQRLSYARDMLAAYEAQITVSSTSMQDSPAGVPSSPFLTTGRPEDHDTSNLNQLEAQLSELQTKYTDRHPGVIRIKASIAKLVVRMQGKQDVQSDQTTLSPESAPPPRADTAIENANRRQADTLKNEIKALGKEISAIERQAEIYQDRVESTPRREQELMSLKRDYNNILSLYNSLLNRKLEAEIAVNMEKKQKGEQFRIVDPARVAEKPISPDMKRIFMLAVAAGLGIGCGFIFVRDYLDSSFKDKEDTEAALGLPILATIPSIFHPNVTKWQAFNRILSMAAIILSIGLFLVFAALTFLGIDRTELLGRFSDATGINLSRTL